MKQGGSQSNVPERCHGIAAIRIPQCRSKHPCSWSFSLEPPDVGCYRSARSVLRFGAADPPYHTRRVIFIHSRIWASGKRTTRFRRRVGIPSVSQRRMVRMEILSTVANSPAVRKSAFGAG